jgi:hypothetical protein
MPRFLRSGHFWAGVVVGAVVGPMVMGKVMPGLKAKIPQ